MYATFIGFAVLIAMLLLGCFINYIKYGKDTYLWDGILFDGFMMLFFIIFIVTICYVIGIVILHVM